CACLRWDARRWRQGAGADVELAERIADGQADPDELAAAHAADPLLSPVLQADAFAAASAVTRGPVEDAVAYACLLHEVAGNPFRPVAVEPAWLSWGGGTVGGLARVAHDERRFGLLPVLADALEDAGCADRALLGHCRSGLRHVRGCW